MTNSISLDNFNNKTAFTIAELLITITIVGILATFAIPRFRVGLEKVTAAEGVETLRTIYNAAQIYYQENGVHATTISDLYATFKASNNFAVPAMLDPSVSGGMIASVRRGGLYTLLINDTGTAIQCDDSTTTWAGVCTELGY